MLSAMITSVILTGIVLLILVATAIAVRRDGYGKTPPEAKPPPSEPAPTVTRSASRETMPRLLP